MRIERKTAQVGIRTQLPVPTSLETFKIKHKTYEVLRFPEGQGPNMEETMTIVRNRSGGEMLAALWADKIRKDNELNTAFKKILKPGEWCYVRHPPSESGSLAAYLINDGIDCTVFIYSMRPSYTSDVVLLKLKTKAKSPKPIKGVLRVS